MHALQWLMCLALLSLAGSAVAQIDTSVCSETIDSEKLPPTPQRFHFTMSTVTTPGNNIGHVSLMVDTESSKSAVTVENLVSNSEDFKLIFDTGTDQILQIDRQADEFQIDNCQVRSGAEKSLLMTKVTYKGADRLVPSGRLLTPPMEMKIHKGSEINQGELKMTPYTACYYDADAQATVKIEWIYPAGSNSPWQIQSSYKFSSGDIVNTLYALTPVRNMSQKHDATRHPLTAPKGVYCKGLVSSKKAPEPNNRFGFGMEEFVGLSSGLPSPVEQPYTIHESYDQRNNITLLEADATLFFAMDQGKYGTGRLAKINDFTRGISYIKNIHFGNCTFDKISDDGWDTNKSPGGPRLKLPGEFYFPSLSELQYKGSGVYRDTDVDIYVGFKDNYVDIGDGKKYPVTVEYYLQIKTTYDMEGNPKYQSVPRGVYSAVPPPLRVYTMSDVFDFNTGLPRAYDHDISDCFTSTQVQHFELIMTTADIKDDGHLDYLRSHLDELLYSVVNSLSRAVNISPLRIFQPKISLFAEPLLLVEITISDRANVPNYTPKQPEATLAEVVPKITELVSNNRLFVQVLDGEIAFDVPINDFVQMDTRGSDYRGSQGMSAGAVAGLSIGMIILGAVLALLAIFALSYFRKDPLFGFKPFGNGSE